MAWLGIAATVAFNFHQYRKGRMTICAVTRRVLPEAVFVVAFRVGADMLEEHVVGGYPAR